MMDLGIIVVNWNGGEGLNRSVLSIIDSVGLPAKTVIYLVDNASTDDSVVKLDQRVLSGVRLIQSETNLGFGKACNLVFNEYSHDLYLLLNPDAEVLPHSISKSLQFILENKDIDILGVRNISPDGKTMRTCARIPTLSGYLRDISGLSKILPGIFKPATIMTDWDHLNSSYVDHVIASFVLIRGRLLQTIGVFDERFFLYLEDLDLSSRVREIGGHIYYNADIVVIHEGGGTSGAILDKRLFYSLQSRMLFAEKYFAKFSYFTLAVATITIEPITRLFYILFSLRFREIGHLFKGYGLFFGWIFRGYRVDKSKQVEDE